jgi:GBP family porin
MKKPLMVAALSGMFATAAHAQSSVTLYGVIDAGVTYTNNQGDHSNWQETDGAISPSRWGLRGAEDLGGGLKAIFTLENGFSVTNGTLSQNGREFGRQAFVGLSSNEFGTVTLGRQYDSVVDYLSPLALTGTQYGGTFFAHPFDNDNFNGSFRINNSVKYASANYAGLMFGALYGFSNTAGQFSNNRAYSFGATYNFAGFNFAAAYLQLNGSSLSATAAGATAGDAAFAAGRQRTWGAGVNYTFGPATAGFVFTQSRFSNASGINSFNSGATASVALPAGSSLRFNNYEINGRYTLTRALSLQGNYTYTDGEFNGVHPKWHQFDLMADYALSTRTDVYLEGEYQRVVTSGTGFTADILGLRASSTDKQVAVTAGIRHRF